MWYSFFVELADCSDEVTEEAEMTTTTTTTTASQEDFILVDAEQAEQDLDVPAALCDASMPLVEKKWVRAFPW